MTTHILLVEDEASISEPLAFLLEREGYRVSVESNGTEALAAFSRLEPDLILLDLMLPGVPGTEVCRAIRTQSNVPIIMLTAKDSEIDIVVGLELGADDYITKPYSTRELLARVRAALRRREAGEAAATAEGPGTSRDSLGDDASEAIEAHGIRVDAGRHSVTVRGTEVSMPLREFELLSLLMENSGRVLTRGQLIDRIWGSDYFGDTKTLDVHIKRLRSRIEEEPSSPTLIMTVRGVGYRFG